MYKQNESINKDTAIIKRYQKIVMLKIITAKMKNSLKGFNKYFRPEEEIINKLEYRTTEITQFKRKKKKKVNRA